MGKKNKGRQGLPKQIFVSRRGEGDSVYLEAQSSAQKMVDVWDTSRNKGNGIAVGIYVLKEVGEITTETSYKRKRFTKA
jgi:hypothetical protein